MVVNMSNAFSSTQYTRINSYLSPASLSNIFKGDHSAKNMVADTSTLYDFHLQILHVLLCAILVMYPYGPASDL